MILKKYKNHDLYGHILSLVKYLFCGKCYQFKIQFQNEVSYDKIDIYNLVNLATSGISKHNKFYGFWCLRKPNNTIPDFQRLHFVGNYKWTKSIERRILF